MKQLNYNEQSKRVKERRVAKAPRGGPQDVRNGDAVTVKSRQSFSRTSIDVDKCRKPEGSKRQRTASASPSSSPSRELHRFASQADSDDGTNGRPSGGKKIRGAAARNHKEKELREEREKARLEAATKRKGRAERRRVEGQLRGHSV